jgi:hypothetical protein
MPEFLIRNLDAPPKYARIAPNGRAVTWVGQAAATGFLDSSAARLAFDTACSAMGDRATAKMEEGLADGTIEATPGSWHGNFQRLGKHASAAIDFFASQWLRDGWESNPSNANISSPTPAGSSPTTSWAYSRPSTSAAPTGGSPPSKPSSTRRL